LAQLNIYLPLRVIKTDCPECGIAAKPQMATDVSARKEGSVTLYTADTAEGLLHDSRNAIEPIVELSSLAAINKQSVFNGNIWPKRHITMHGNRFPNTLYDAVLFAVSLANHAPHTRLPTKSPRKSPRAMCAQNGSHQKKSRRTHSGRAPSGRHSLFTLKRATSWRLA
jgi:hypothetical protein